MKAWTLNTYAPRLAYLDAHLKDREFLLDRFSVADGYLTTVLNWTRATPQIDLALYPHVRAYLERMRSRRSVAQALATGRFLCFRRKLSAARRLESGGSRFSGERSISRNRDPTCL